MDGLIGSARTISQSRFVDHLLHAWTDEENYFLPGEELVGERPEGEWNQFDSLFVPMPARRVSSSATSRPTTRSTGSGRTTRSCA